MMTQAYLQRIATAVPTHNVHPAFVSFAENMLQEDRSRTLFMRMAARCGIDQRYSSLSVTKTPGDVDAYSFYRLGAFPSTRDRMRLFEQFAPQLARTALDRLALTDIERARVKHVIVTSCTGLYAPGLDFAVIDHLGLPDSTERTMIGFMGCYAAINALKQARHIVRSHPGESLVVLNLELCTLHFQESQNLAEVLSFLVFGDGCTASLIGSEPVGFELESFRSMQIPDTRDLITWRVNDLGFDMFLSGRVPGEIGKALSTDTSSFAGNDLWAVHPGGASILDAAQDGLSLTTDDLCASRSVLKRFGNMSSATVMFVLHELMREAKSGQRGCAMSFGPGLTAETMRFHAV